MQKHGLKNGTQLFFKFWPKPSFIDISGKFTKTVQKYSMFLWKKVSSLHNYKLIVPYVKIWQDIWKIYMIWKIILWRDGWTW